MLVLKEQAGRQYRCRQRFGIGRQPAVSRTKDTTGVARPYFHHNHKEARKSMPASWSILARQSSGAFFVT